jgi:tRNA/rRNA methyltransferase
VTLEQLRVVLVSTRNPLNIGAAARAMSNFGCASMRVVNPYDVAFREARSAVRGAGVLQSATEYESVSDAVADCTLVVGSTAVGHRELQHKIYGLPEAAKRIRRQLVRGPVALLFGSEKYGLSNEDMAHCNWLLHIDTPGTNESMNLGQAVAVCLYEISRSASTAQARPKKQVTAGDREQITRMLIEAARESGYLKEPVSASTELKIRRLVRRLDLTATDAPVWLGLLRQILWKLRRNEG